MLVLSTISVCTQAEGCASLCTQLVLGQAVALLANLLGPAHNCRAVLVHGAMGEVSAVLVLTSASQLQAAKEWCAEAICVQPALRVPVLACTCLHGPTRSCCGGASPLGPPQAVVWPPMAAAMVWAVKRPSSTDSRSRQARR